MLYLKNKILHILNDILDNLDGKTIELDILGSLLKRQYSIFNGNIIIGKKRISLNTYIKRHYGSLKLFIIHYTTYKIFENIVY